MKRLWSLAVAMAVFLGAPAVWGQTPVRGGELTICQSAEPPGLDPTSDAAAAIDRVVWSNLFETLIKVDDQGELIPGLARQWEISSDGTLYTFQLQEKVQFHNGEPFDAKAVKFNVEYQRIHNRTRGVQVYMKHLREVQIIDSHTVRMVLSEPDSLFFDRLILGPTAGWGIGAPKYMERVGWEEFMKRPGGMVFKLRQHHRLPAERLLKQRRNVERLKLLIGQDVVRCQHGSGLVVVEVPKPLPGRIHLSDLPVTREDLNRQWGLLHQAAEMLFALLKLDDLEGETLVKHRIFQRDGELSR